jgi:murein L,D-transpeptidase YcbB/YkuD
MSFVGFVRAYAFSCPRMVMVCVSGPMLRHLMTVPVLMALATACTEPVAPDNSDMVAENIRAQQVETFIRSFALEAPDRAIRAAEARVNLPTLQAALTQGLSFESDDSLQTIIRDGYASRAWQPLFVNGSHLTPAGQALLAAIQSSRDHGLYAADYWLAEIQSRQERLAAGTRLEEIRTHLQMTPEDQGALLAWVERQTATDQTLPAVDAVFGVVAEPSPANPLPRYAETIAQLAASIEGVAQSGPELELYLASAALRYARDMRYENLDGLIPADAAARGWNLEDENTHPAIVTERLTEAWRSALVGDFAAWLEALPPAFEQYDRLVAGAIQYRGFVEQGGWAMLTAPVDLEEGDEGPHVIALRERLASENYFDGDLTTPVFDAALQDALEIYQETHQLNRTGTLSEETISSLNVPADRRLAQIYVTLDRWRQARVERHVGGEYIWVNVPDFHAELWDTNEMVYRWRVVTGQPRRFRDGRVEGRTPLFSDTMLYVVFNPYWNVPREIRESEYQHLIDADPLWLSSNGFEIVLTEDGGDFLRQLPGPANALGQVKFLFPNEHDVYMHDTPSRNLFSRPVRAFSHGCVRVHEPLDLAHLLLSRDMGWSESRTDDFIEEQLLEGTEQWVNLRTPLSIHIEYYTVRGDENGRMHFLADIYRYDRQRVNERQLEINPAAIIPE